MAAEDEKWDSLPEHYELLSGLIRAVRPGLVVETGTGAFAGAKVIVAALEKNGHGRLVTVDSGEVSGFTHPAMEVVRADSLEFVRSLNGVGVAWVDCAVSLRHRLRVVERLRRNGARYVLMDDVSRLGGVQRIGGAMYFSTSTGLALWGPSLEA